MPALAESINTKLLATAGVTALVGSGDSAKIFPGIAPDATIAPYVVWQYISTLPATTHDEATQLEFVTVQFSCLGPTYLDAINLRAAIRSALENQTLAAGEKVIDFVEHDDFEPAVDLHLVALDVRFAAAPRVAA